MEEEVSNKRYVEYSKGEGTSVRFNQTLENFLKVPVRKDVYNLMNYYKIQITDTTVIKYPNEGKFSLQKWNILYKDWNGNGK